MLGIALTDTFGTPAFLKAFSKEVPQFTTAAPGPATTLPSTAAGSTMPGKESLSNTQPPIHAPLDGNANQKKTYAQVFAGVRQDSGDPLDFIKMMREFYDQQGIKEKKTVVFSDSLNVELCLKYKEAAEGQGFQPTFGVGTFLTSKSVFRSTHRSLLIIKQMTMFRNQLVRSLYH